MDIPFSIQQKFMDFIKGDIRAADFEKWIYKQPELESLMGEEKYVELLSLNFQQKRESESAKRMLRQCIDFGAFETHRILNLVQEIRENSKSCQPNLKDTYHLYGSGYNFLDNLGIGYGLKLVVPYEFGVDEWEELIEQKREEIVNGFYPQLAEEAEKVINWIRTGKVKLSGKKNERGHWEFIDKRTEAERKATAYRKKE